MGRLPFAVNQTSQNLVFLLIRAQTWSTVPGGKSAFNKHGQVGILVVVWFGFCDSELLVTY